MPAPGYQSKRDELLAQIKNLPQQFRERALGDLSKLYDEEFIKRFKEENAELFKPVEKPVQVVLKP